MSRAAVTAVLRNFSSSNNSSKWELSGDERIFLIYFDPLFYANGNCKENEGYVSIVVRRKLDLRERKFEENEIRCYVSVVDVAGNKRFTQSAVYFHGKIKLQDIQNAFHLKRETLLNDPPELLPGDCLTVCVELDYIQLFSMPDRCTESPFYLDFKYSFQFCIPIDMDFGRELCRLSDYFRRASDTSMIEGRTRMVRIPYEELYSFHYVFSIIFKRAEELELKSMEDVCRLYVVADKYDIPLVIETCRELINAFLRTTDDPKVREHVARRIPEIMKLAETYRDGDLEEDVLSYIYSKKNFEMNDYVRRKYLKKKWETGSTEWKCKYEEHYFKMRKNEKPEFEFYQ